MRSHPSTCRRHSYPTADKPRNLLKHTQDIAMLEQAENDYKARMPKIVSEYTVPTYDRIPLTDARGLQIFFQGSEKIASIDVDAQKTFTFIHPDEVPVLEGAHIGPELNAQARYAHYRIFSKDTHSIAAIWKSQNPADFARSRQPIDTNDVNAPETWPAHAIVGTDGFELLETLPEVYDYDFFVYKGAETKLHPYGACYHGINPRTGQQISTGMIEFLQAKNVTHVIVGGLALDYCVKTTVQELLAAGFFVAVNVAATRGVFNSTIDDSIVANQAVAEKYVTDNKHKMHSTQLTIPRIVYFKNAAILKEVFGV